MTLFTVATLLRSRRHRLIVTAYVGLALAIATMSVVAGGMHGTLRFDRPYASLLAVPLVAIFFVTLGLRAAFAVPSDLDANWIFRLSQPHVTSAADATAFAMFMVSIAPLALLSTIGSMLLEWSPHDAAAIGLADVSCGLVLIEWALRGWRTIPFTCARAGDAETVKSRWLGHVLPLIVFAFVNAAIQTAMLRADRSAGWYVATAVTVWLIQRIRRRFAARHASVQFDAPPSDTMATLDLSEAIG